MARLIDADALDYKNYKIIDKSSDFLDGVIYMAERIEEAPTIEIVRCIESAEVPGRVQIIRKEIERLCENCERPTKEETKEKALGLVAFGFSVGLNADRPQGKWLDVWQDGICSWRGTCSVCRSTNDIPPPFEANFCPSCGARMKGADDE